ncbi:hypothetical protein DH2020_044363 [Rehmannia glutinosa]|uniref:Nuclear pore complex protein n=1 Tax=Rehmannia glutinosa TaxID=99300 RepID=A0ABR0UHW4_REHGL
MRFAFDLTEPDERQSPSPPPSNSLAFGSTEPNGRQSPTPSPSNSTTKAELQWFPLQNHPLFSSATASAVPCLRRKSASESHGVGWSFSALFLGFKQEVLQAKMPLSFEVNKISINRDGSAMLLVGLEGLRFMHLYGHSSPEENTIICRTISIGPEIYFNRNNFIRILQISWHPYSDTHLGILSSDSVFDLGQPEQEYYLQPVEPGSSRNAAAICPVDFSFGRDHLWDRFSVFILFSDGSTYIICPVVPFGSMYLWESILEMYNDAHTFGLKSANPKAVNNSNMAISWLEATFPELLVHQAGDGGKLLAVKARPFVLLDASVSLQGPLHKVCHGVTEDSEVRTGLCEGRAVSFLYNLVGKDSILVTAWSGGQLQLDALADEIHPVWKTGSPPRLCVDSSDQILGAAMICESAQNDRSILKIDQTPYHTVWLGHPPPLLRLAINLLRSYRRDRFDRLAFSPFTNQTTGKEGQMRTPSVFSVLSTFPGDSSSPSPLNGFLALADSFGSSWIVGLTSSNDCIVLQMETWNVLLTDVIDRLTENVVSDELKETETDIPTVISKELLSGPKAVLLPPSAPNLRSVTADSIEGRSMLHQYFKLFHENYVEYAHKHHGPHLKRIIDNQHSRLREMEQKLLQVERKQEKIDDRMDQAVRFHSSIEERLVKLRRLPGSHKSHFPKQRDFKSELDKFTGLELDALNSTIEALRASVTDWPCINGILPYENGMCGYNCCWDSFAGSVLLDLIEPTILLRQSIQMTRNSLKNDGGENFKSDSEAIKSNQGKVEKKIESRLHSNVHALCPSYDSDGGKIECNSKCPTFEWEMGNCKFCTSVRILQLGGCDMVIGVDLPRKLVLRTFDFNNHGVKFEWKGKPVYLKA